MKSKNWLAAERLGGHLASWHKHMDEPVITLSAFATLQRGDVLPQDLWQDYIKSNASVAQEQTEFVASIGACLSDQIKEDTATHYFMVFIGILFLLGTYFMLQSPLFLQKEASLLISIALYLLPCIGIISAFIGLALLRKEQADKRVLTAIEQTLNILSCLTSSSKGPSLNKEECWTVLGILHTNDRGSSSGVMLKKTWE